MGGRTFETHFISTTRRSRPKKCIPAKKDLLGYLQKIQEMVVKTVPVACYHYNTADS